MRVRRERSLRCSEDFTFVLEEEVQLWFGLLVGCFRLGWDLGPGGCVLFFEHRGGTGV